MEKKAQRLKAVSVQLPAGLWARIGVHCRDIGVFKQAWVAQKLTAALGIETTESAK